MNLERQSRELLETILSGTGIFKVNRVEQTGQTAKWDVVVDVEPTSAPGFTERLFVECRSRITPHDALGSVFKQLHGIPKGGVPVIFAPTISNRLQDLCREEGVSYLDAAGNCRIACHGLYIERVGFRKETAAKRTPTINPFSLKSSRIIRVLLTNMTQGWQVQRLAQWDCIRVSLGLASKVKRALIEQGYVIEHDRLLYVRDPEGLLRDWVANYVTDYDEVPLYVSGELADAEIQIAKWCRWYNIEYALTQFSGAWRTAPEVRYNRATIYVNDGAIDEAVWRGLSDFGRAKPVDTGANVMLWRTRDPAVFLGKQQSDTSGMWVASPLQLYLDLARTAGRGEDAAHSVYEKELKPRFEQRVQPNTQGDADGSRTKA